MKAIGKILLLQYPLELLGDVTVHGSQNLVHEFDDRHSRAEPLPDRSHLKTDHAAADDNHLLRDLRQLQRAGGGDDLGGALGLLVAAWRGRLGVGAQADARSAALLRSITSK